MIRGVEMKPKDYADVWLKFSWWEFCAGRVYLNAIFLFFFSFYLWEHVEVYSVHFFFTFLYFLWEHVEVYSVHFFSPS